MNPREYIWPPWRRADLGRLPANQLAEWLVDKLADLPEETRKTAIFDCVLGMLSVEKEKP